MSMAAVLLKRIFSLLLLIFRTLLRLLTCRWLFGRPQQRIGELPMFHGDSQSNRTSPNVSGWSDWAAADDRQSAIGLGVSEQIEEYRRRRQEEMAAQQQQQKGGGKKRGHQPAEKSREPDLFADLQPEFKATKKLLLRSKQSAEGSPPASARNLFQMREDEQFPFPLEDRTCAELGELEFDDSATVKGRGRERATSWLDEEEDVDVAELDAFDRYQRRRERELRNKQRQIEHAQKVEAAKHKGRGGNEFHIQI